MQPTVRHASIVSYFPTVSWWWWMKSKTLFSSRMIFYQLCDEKRLCVTLYVNSDCKQPTKKDEEDEAQPLHISVLCLSTRTRKDPSVKYNGTRAKEYHEGGKERATHFQLFPLGPSVLRDLLPRSGIILSAIYFFMLLAAALQLQVLYHQVLLRLPNHKEEEEKRNKNRRIKAAARGVVFTLTSYHNFFFLFFHFFFKEEYVARSVSRVLFVSLLGFL